MSLIKFYLSLNLQCQSEQMKGFRIIVINILNDWFGHLAQKSAYIIMLDIM